MCEILIMFHCLSLQSARIFIAKSWPKFESTWIFQTNLDVRDCPSFELPSPALHSLPAAFCLKQGTAIMASKKHDMAWYRTHRMNTQPPPHVDTKLPARPRYLQEKEQKPPPQAPINGFKSRLAASPATESQPTVKSSSMAAVAPAAEPPPNNTYIQTLESALHERISDKQSLQSLRPQSRRTH